MQSIQVESPVHLKCLIDPSPTDVFFASAVFHKFNRKRNWTLA